MRSGGGNHSFAALLRTHDLITFVQIAMGQRLSNFSDNPMRPRCDACASPYFVDLRYAHTTQPMALVHW